MVDVYGRNMSLGNLDDLAGAQLRTGGGAGYVDHADGGRSGGAAAYLVRDRTRVGGHGNDQVGPGHLDGRVEGSDDVQVARRTGRVRIVGQYVHFDGERMRKRRRRVVVRRDRRRAVARLRPDDNLSARRGGRAVGDLVSEVDRRGSSLRCPQLENVLVRPDHCRAGRDGTVGLGQRLDRHLITGCDNVVGEHVDIH